MGFSSSAEAFVARAVRVVGHDRASDCRFSSDPILASVLGGITSLTTAWRVETGILLLFLLLAIATAGNALFTVVTGK